ncbi:hypothetical protein FDP41_011234 [Naegleria fowleri]|uniref:NmrA-like domain-containing protein n=1 Tax=Naegleria fowleri TaxID=5763 RepID=A0A6A5C734_NAEFO|nr:uncharacterized protein FDP41_011234 [Naegleria fowleri]KAF0982304.1 hypothetical protein FDP41_011234 [Naegleria fowleri]CAG4709284.1 unnamed protein product [Naegleria fowleri]
MVEIKQQQQQSLPTSPLKIMICSGENDDLGHQLAETLVKRGAKVTLLVHPNHTSSNYVKHLTETIGCEFVLGGAMEDEPLELVKKLHGQNVIISASLRNSLLHPMVQYKTDINLLKTCHLYALQPNSDFRCFIPCQWSFDFTKFTTPVVKQEEVEWNWIECKKGFLQMLRADNGGVPYMSFFTGFPMDFLIEFLVDSVNKQIKCYGEDWNDYQIVCTSINDICQLASEKILHINPLSSFSTQEFTFYGECCSLKQIAQHLNYKLTLLGSVDDCTRKITNLRDKILQCDHHGCEKEKYELACLLIMQFIASGNFKNYTFSPQPGYTVTGPTSHLGGPMIMEKKYEFDRLENLVNKIGSSSSQVKGLTPNQ